MPDSVYDFQKALDSVFASALADGRDSVEVVSGDLHRLVGGYPGHDHRMPACCQVMKSNMKPGDSVVAGPPSGQGASLAIRYRIPR